MEINKKNTFVPLKAIHPFDILKEELRARGIKGKDFACQIGIQPSNFSRMIKNKGEITYEMAKKFEEALDIPYLHWMKLQDAYREDLASIDARESEEGNLKWLEDSIGLKLNLEELYLRLGLLLKPLKVRVQKLKDFLPMIESIDKNFTIGLFKKSQLLKTDEKNLRTWVILANCKAIENSEGLVYTDGNAEKAARELAREANAGRISKAITARILNENGIGFSHVPKLEKTPVDAYSITCNKVPSIIVTYRLSDSNKFIFDILHELGHIALHSQDNELKGFIKLDDGEYYNALEEEADKFASQHLISDDKWDLILSSSSKSLNPYKVSQMIGDTAKSIGINPSLAVSRYKHEIKKFDIPSYRSKPLQ